MNPVEKAAKWIDVDMRVWEADDTGLIRVWDFEDAPQQLRDLSSHGGDEDWIALVPPRYRRDWIPWAETGTAFGRCDVTDEELPNGWRVLIGAHA